MDSLNVDEMLEYTGIPQYKAVYTVTLAELIDEGVFDWSKDYLTWETAAYDPEQYERVCNYFIARYKYREISMEPFKIWANYLQYKLVYELMPKYRFLYAEAAKKVSMDFSGLETIDGSTHDDEYYKRREIESAYPETLLSHNSDYITNGNDLEDERIRDHTENKTHEKKAPAIEYMANIEKYLELMGQIDKKLLDELEIMFISLYSANYNGF